MSFIAVGNVMSMCVSSVYLYQTLKIKSEKGRVRKK